MRLIDADKLPIKHGVNVGANYGGLRAIVFKKDIDNAPTVDAVPVVRCKDCAHSVPAIIDGQRKCELLPMVFFEDDYCSMGERREDGTN